MTQPPPEIKPAVPSTDRVTQGCRIVLISSGVIAALSVVLAIGLIGYVAMLWGGVFVSRQVVQGMKAGEGEGFTSEITFVDSRYHWAWNQSGPHVYYRTVYRCREQPTFALERDCFLEPLTDGRETVRIAWDGYLPIKQLNRMDPKQRAAFAASLYDLLPGAADFDYVEPLSEAKLEDEIPEGPDSFIFERFGLRVIDARRLEEIRQRARARGEYDDTWILQSLDYESEYYVPYQVLYYDGSQWIVRETVVR